MTVINRLPALIGEKQLRENRVVSVAEIVKATGLRKQTVYNWLHGGLSRYDADAIQAFCGFFKCTVDELLVVVPEEETPTPEN